MWQEFGHEPRWRRVSIASNAGNGSSSDRSHMSDKTFRNSGEDGRWTGNESYCGGGTAEERWDEMDGQDLLTLCGQGGQLAMLNSSTLPLKKMGWDWQTTSLACRLGAKRFIFRGLWLLNVRGVSAFISSRESFQICFFLKKQLL